MIEVKDQLVNHTERVFDGTNPSDSVTIHDTDNTQVGADAQAHADLQANNQVRQASWHDQVDDTQAIRSYLPEAQCWHAGDGEGPGNTTSHAIEFCVNADGDLEKTISNLVRLTVRRLDELDLTVDDIVDHSHWSGKHCPRTFKDNPGSWGRFIQAVKDRDPAAPILQGGTPMSKFSSPVPVGCRLTSGFGTRWGTLHAGTDWAPPKPGQTGIPIYAIHDGTILATGTGYGRATDRIPYHSGKYIWQDIGVHGGDRMRLYYGHLASCTVKSGQYVRAGQIIGYMGATGNVTGIHLHLGVSVNHNRPTARWTARTNSGWTDPAVWLRSKGITPGRTAPVKASATATASSGSGIEWPANKLLVDGNFGPVTRRAYQRLLAPSSVGNYTGNIDGNIGPMTVKAEQRWLKNRGYYKGRIDGQRGPMTIRALQNRLHADGFYNGYIDGDFGSLSVKGVQKLMNDQQNLYK